MSLRPRCIERPLTSESPIQCALGSDWGTVGREGGNAYCRRRPAKRFFARRLPTPHVVGSIGLYKRPTSRLGEDGYPKARGILKGIPAWPGDTQGYPRLGTLPRSPGGIP